MSKTLIRQMHCTEVSKKSVDEDVHVVANGATLRVDRFSGGHEYSTKEVRTELIWRSGGDTVIAVGYGPSYQLLVEEDFIGDGAAALVVKHVNQDSGALSMAAWWEGLEYTQ